MPDCQTAPISNEYADFILQYSPRSIENIYELTATGCVNLISDEFAVIHALRDRIGPMSASRFSYAAIPKLYGLLDTTALESSGIPIAFDQPNLRATGRGVMIGIVDTGIDYTNTLFRNADGSTRIMGLWDQTIQSETLSTAVAGFQPFYGTTYTREQINEALNSDDPFSVVPSRDTDGHGTYLAGVAAGNRIQQPIAFSGAAPEATLAIVKLKPAKQYLRDYFLIRPDIPAYQENDIMAAVSYLLGLANQQQMPLVICLGLGTSQGNHEGTSLLSIQLQDFDGFPGLVAVAAAGNEVGYHHHFLGHITSDMEYEDVELRVGADETGFSMELWAREPELFTVGFVSPSGEVIDRIPLSLGTEASIPFQLDATVITVNYLNYEGASGNQLILFRFQSPAPGIWHIRIYPEISISGRFHMWLPMHGFLSDDTIFLRPNPDTTITDPGNASMPLTIGAYDHTNNRLFVHSSRGYTRYGNIKPDLAAPGVSVQGPAVRTADRFGNSAENTSRQLLSENAAELPSSDELSWTRRSGTSVSAAIAAGALADIFTWAFTDRNNLTLSGNAAKAMLIRGADRNPDFSYPNREWGYGTLNLYGAFLNSRE